MDYIDAIDMIDDQWSIERTLNTEMIEPWRGACVSRIWKKS